MVLTTRSLLNIPGMNPTYPRCSHATTSSGSLGLERALGRERGRGPVGKRTTVGATGRKTSSKARASSSGPAAFSTACTPARASPSQSAAAA
jgi:hypothetical protein